VKAASLKVESRIRNELAELASQAQLRGLRAVPGVDLSSNDYLGLAVDPRMKQAVHEAIDGAQRIASTGSRLLSGHDEAWNALEQEFASWIGADAALYFTSGYAANLGLLTAILRPEDVVFSDSANHASLIDGMRLSKAKRVIFSHRDLDNLESELKRQVACSGGRFIVVEGIFSMDGDRAPLGDLAAIADRHNAELIVDEAHATGACGPEGRGCVAEAGLTPRVFATVHTCSKAMAAAGAFVCGSDLLRRLLINRARTFIFNTALPPYFAAQVAAGMRLAKSGEAERSHLSNLGAYLRTALHDDGFDVLSSDSHIVPILLGSNELALEFATRLQARGYGIRAIRPPTVPPGMARLRLSLTARLARQQLADLSRELLQVRAELFSMPATRRA
jgi:8-amino-7-oxononanoate synthase